MLRSNPRAATWYCAGHTLVLSRLTTGRRRSHRIPLGCNVPMVSRVHLTQHAPANIAPDEAKRLDGRARSRFHFFIAGLCVAYFTIIIRCAYRVPEMVDGWGGELMQDEPTFFGLEGAMMAIACIALTITHPVFFFPPMQRVKNRVTPEQQSGSEGEVEKASRDA